MSDAARFLVDSPDRLDLLERLRESPGDPRDIAVDMDQSRRSIQRHLGAFEERGWVRTDEDRYALTTKGEVIARTHRESLESLETIETQGDLYEPLPTDVAPDPALLTDATVVTADRDHPQAPVSHYASVVESVETDRFRMIAPVLSRIFHEVHADRVLDGVSIELVLDTETTTAPREKHPAEFATVVSVPRYQLYRHPPSIDFGLTVADERAVLLAYGDSGQVTACADSEHPEFLTWVESLFGRYRSGAKSVSARDTVRP
jgi:predicted transcriptional regulator